MNKVETKKILNFIDKHAIFKDAFGPHIAGIWAFKDGENIESADVGLDTMEFLKKYEEKLDFKKLLISTLHALSRLNEQGEKSIYTIPYNNLLKLARENISESEEVITIAIEGQIRNIFTPINSKTLLYGKAPSERKFKIDSQYLSELFYTITETNISYLFADSTLSSSISNSLLDNVFDTIHYGEKELDMITDEETGNLDFSKIDGFEEYFNEEKNRFLAIPEIRNLILEDNLYVIAAFSYITGIKNCIQDFRYYIKEYERLQDEGLSEEELEIFKQEKRPLISSSAELSRLSNILHQILERLDPKKVTVDIVEINMEKGTEESKTFSLEMLREEIETAISSYASMYIREDKRELFNVETIKFLKKDVAIRFATGINGQEKLEYYFLLYEAGHINYGELTQYLKDNNASEEDMHKFAERAVIRKLTDSNNVDNNIMKRLGLINSEYKSSETDTISIEKFIDDKKLLENAEEDDVFFSKSLADEGLYVLLDDTLKLEFYDISMRHYTSGGFFKDVALKNIMVLLEKGDLNIEDLKTMYSIYGMGIDEIEKAFGKDRLKNSFTANSLLETINDIKNNREKRNTDEESEKLYQTALKEYQYLKAVNQKYGLTNNTKVEEELLEELDDLIFDEALFATLYVDGFVSGKTLYGYNDNLAVKLFNEGKLRPVDQRYMIFNSDIEVKAGDLIRLKEAEALSNKDIVDLYMQNKVSLFDISVYAEDFDIAEGFTDDELMKYARDYSIIGKSAEKESFKRFTDGFVKYRTLEPEQEEKIYKMIVRRHPSNEEVIDFYSKGLFSMETINPSDDLLVSMIKQGRLKAEDEEKLFKDTTMQGTKYIRLMKVLRKLDSDEEKLNLLASVYKTEDEISTTRLNILANELSEVYSEDTERMLGPNIKYDDIDYDETTDKIKPKEQKPTSKSRAVRSLAKMFDAFKSIKANYEHQLVAGTYIVYLDSCALVEQVFKKSGDNQKFSLDHATYIISENFFRHYLKDEYDGNFRDRFNDFFVDVNRYGRPIFRWQVLVKAKKKNVVGIDKAVHKKNWARNLKIRAGYGDVADKLSLQRCLNDIEEVDLDNEVIE